MDLIEQTREHLLRTLENGCEETKNVPYRYEHSLRVAAVGREIARAEGFDEEAMVLACLLHDIGYARCRTPEEYSRHGALSAGMAREWLTENSYDPEQTETICYGILAHTEHPEKLPRPCTPFEDTVGDADNIDRFDALRMADTLAYFDLMQKRPAEILELCRRQIGHYEGYKTMPLGTRTAEVLWRDRLSYQIEFYRRLERQMEQTAL